MPALLERLYDRTRVLAALTGTRRGEARIANLEKVAALARQAGELGVLTLRGFTRLLATRMSESAEEPDLPATRPGDPDTVRILSIHKAKGLEAPIVVLYDLDARLRTQSDVIALWDEGRVAIGFRAGCRPPGWNALSERDQSRARAEGRRLLYVACTRARDFLVDPPAAAGRADRRFLEGPAAVRGSGARGRGDERRRGHAAERVPVTRETGGPARAGGAPAGGDAAAARWERERAELIEFGGDRPFVPIAALRAVQRDQPSEAVAVRVAHRPALRQPRAPGARVGGSRRARPRRRCTGSRRRWPPSSGSTRSRDGAPGDAAAAALGLPVMARARGRARASGASCRSGSPTAAT